MNGLRRAAAGPSVRSVGPALLVAGLMLITPFGGAAGQQSPAAPPGATPPLADPAAVDEGRSLYGRRCYICHLAEGGRGPNLRATTLSDDAFVRTVLDGRKGKQMPAFKGLLTPDEIAKIRVFLRAAPPG